MLEGTTILPFSVGGFQLTHTRGDEALDNAARDHWRENSSKAAEQWRNEQWEQCEPDGYDDSLAFSVEFFNEPYGTFGLYAIEAIGGDPFVVSAMCAPMLPGVELASKPWAPIEGAEEYWGAVFGLLQHLLNNPLPTTDPGGRLFAVDEWPIGRAHV